ELLCEALEAFREWQPDAELEFEHAVLLVSGVVESKSVSLGFCSECRGAMLIDRLGTQGKTCGLCRRLRSEVDEPATPARQETNDSVIDNHERTQSQRQGDDAPERELRACARHLEGDRDGDTEQHQSAAHDLDERR